MTTYRRIFVLFKLHIQRHLTVNIVSRNKYHAFLELTFNFASHKAFLQFYALLQFILFCFQKDLFYGGMTHPSFAR